MYLLESMVQSVQEKPQNVSLRANASTQPDHLFVNLASVLHVPFPREGHDVVCRHEMSVNEHTINLPISAVWQAKNEKIDKMDAPPSRSVVNPISQ